MSFGAVGQEDFFFQMPLLSDPYIFSLSARSTCSPLSIPHACSLPHSRNRFRFCSFAPFCIVSSPSIEIAFGDHDSLLARLFDGFFSSPGPASYSPLPLFEFSLLFRLAKPNPLPPCAASSSAFFLLTETEDYLPAAIFREIEVLRSGSPPPCSMISF